MLPIRDELTKFLSENTGTQVKTLALSGGELWARVQAEKPNIGADVIFGFGPGPAILREREGLWVPYPDAPAFRSGDAVTRALTDDSHILPPSAEG